MKNILLLTLLVTVSGCASVLVTNDGLQTKTATALDVDQGSITISNRVDDGVKTTYSVKTDTGKNYSCTVFATVSVVGRVVTDPICTPIKQHTGSNSASCNALLKAAGKCN